MNDISGPNQNQIPGNEVEMNNNEEIKSDQLYQENKTKPKNAESSDDSDSDSDKKSSSETSSYSSQGKKKKFLKGNIKMGDKNIELGELSDDDLEEDLDQLIGMEEDEEGPTSY
jgi:hypothetical protein